MLSCCIGLFGAKQWNSPYTPRKKCPLLPSSKQQHSQRSDNMSGDKVGREGKHFSSYSNWKPCPFNDGDQYCCRRTRHTALPWKQAAHHLVSLGHANHNPLPENWLYGINTLNERCTTAVCSPVKDWDSAWPICKWRKMTVWALIRDQKGSWPPNIELRQFIHYFFHFLPILTADIFGFVDSPVSSSLFPKAQSDATFWEVQILSWPW